MGPNHIFAPAYWARARGISQPVATAILRIAATTGEDPHLFWAWAETVPPVRRIILREARNYAVGPVSWSS